MEQYQVGMKAVLLAAETILESSGETYRAEETALRMAQAFGFDRTEILAFPTGFTIAFYLKEGWKETHVVRIRDRAIQLDSINEVNTISRKAACGEMSAMESLKALQTLRSRPVPHILQQSLIFALSAGSFSVMFGGGFTEFLVSFIAGFLMRTLMPLYWHMQAPAPLVALFSGAVAAIASLVLIRVFGGNQEAIIAGAIMPLLPGIAMTNAVRDTMRGDLISGTARGADAFLSAVLLAAGVAIVMML